MAIRLKDALLPLDVVETDYSGKITRHIVTARFRTQSCQSGVTYRVVPAVPKSGGEDSKIDHDWFRRIGHIEMTADKRVIYVEAK